MVFVETRPVDTPSGPLKQAGPRRQTKASRLVLVAALAGTVHAAFSLFWALGGTWLLDTVGDWAVRLTTEEPLLAGVGLAGLASLKLLAAWIPVLVEAGHLRGRARWRRVSWIGGLGLIVYGGLNTLVALAVITGLATPEGGYDHAAMLGHAFLWDPMFLLWGASLIASLRATRER